MTRLRRILSLILSAIIVLSFAACGSSSSTTQQQNSQTTTKAAEQKNLTWATWAISEEALKPTYMSMITTFMDKNPDVKIEAVSYPYAQYKDQLIISATAGNAPDIAHIKSEWMPELKNLGALQDLTNVMSDELKADYFPAILAGATENGKINAAPWFNNPYALYYNKNLLKKAGISDLPKNWDELMEAAGKISALGKDENGNKIYGYAIPTSKNEPGAGYNFFPQMWAYGGDFSDKDGNIVINSPANVAAFKTAQDLLKNEISPNGSTFKDLRNLFAQGIIGFYYDLEMAGATFAEASPKGKDFANDYGVMVIPNKDGQNGHGYITEHYFAVFNTCKELDTVGKLIDHLTGPTVLQILYDAGMGKMPDRASVTEMEIFKNPSKETTKAFVAALPSARSLPTGNAYFMQADEALADALAMLTISKDPVEKIVADLDAKVKELYKK